jgi:ribosomal protein S8
MITETSNKMITETSNKMITETSNKMITETNKYHICIPCVSRDINKRDIMNVFIKLKIGYIKYINIRYNSKNNKNRVIVYLKYWYNNERAIKLKEKLKEGLEFNIVYDYPDYWKCVLFVPIKYEKKNIDILSNE